jgi:hypothetical protein
MRSSRSPAPRRTRDPDDDPFGESIPPAAAPRSTSGIARPSPARTRCARHRRRAIRTPWPRSSARAAEVWVPDLPKSQTRALTTVRHGPVGEVTLSSGSGPGGSDDGEKWRGELEVRRVSGGGLALRGPRPMVGRSGHLCRPAAWRRRVREARRASLRSDLAEDPLRRMFFSEDERVLSHPGIVHTYDAGEVDGHAHGRWSRQRRAAARVYRAAHASERLNLTTGVIRECGAALRAQLTDLGGPPLGTCTGREPVERDDHPRGGPRSSSRLIAEGRCAGADHADRRDQGGRRYGPRAALRRTVDAPTSTAARHAWSSGGHRAWPKRTAPSTRWSPTASAPSLDAQRLDAELTRSSARRRGTLRADQTACDPGDALW